MTPGTKESRETDLFKSRIIWLWKSDDLRRLKDGREKSLSVGLSGWWFVGMWSCGFLRATLMSFSSRGRGPSLRMASCSTGIFSNSKRKNPTFEGQSQPDLIDPSLLRPLSTAASTGKPEDLTDLIHVIGFSILNVISENLPLQLFCSPVLNVQVLQVCTNQEKVNIQQISLSRNPHSGIFL